MAKYNLYQSLNLPDHLGCEEIVAILDQKLAAMPPGNYAAAEELYVAKSILGNPERRRLYEQRLFADNGAALGVQELRALAGLTVSGGAGGGDGGGSDGGRGKRNLLIGLAAAAVVAVLGVGGYFGYRALNLDAISGSADRAEGAGSSTLATDSAAAASSDAGASTTTSASGQATAKCTIDEATSVKADGVLDVYTYCDGLWARSGTNQTDYTAILRWVSATGTWEVYPPNDHLRSGFACYDVGRTTADNMPAELRSTVSDCVELPDPSAPSASAPAPGNGAVSSIRTSRGSVTPAQLICDGRSILVIASVVTNSEAEAAQRIGQPLEVNPSAQYALPGGCPSVRAVDDAGTTVYPVFIPQTGTTGELCAQAGNYDGGYVRILEQTETYRSPC